MKSPLKQTGLYSGSLTQPTQTSAFSPNYTGLKLQFGSELPSVYGTGAGLSSSYEGLNLGGGGGTFGGTATNLIGSSGDAFTQTVSAGGGVAATGGGGGINMSAAQMGAVASGIGGIIQGLVGRTKRRNQQIDAQNQYDDMLAKYRDLDTSNLYADIENPYANIQTNFENVFEDLTVNQQQAEFQRQTLARQQAGLMQGLSGAAGGSGIAALAQALANQGQIGAQRISASIGQQEAMNQRLLAQGAAREQALETQAELQVAKGQAMTDQLRLRGAEQARALDYRKTGTELGMAQQDLAAKNMAIAQADAALYGGIGSLVGTAATAAVGAV